jgi:hypothetical protein
MMIEFLFWLQERIKLWTQPATQVLIISFMRGCGDCQEIDGGLVKSRDKCPLLSTRVTMDILLLQKYERMNQVASTAIYIWAYPTTCLPK